MGCLLSILSNIFKKIILKVFVIQLLLKNGISNLKIKKVRFSEINLPFYGGGQFYLVNISVSLGSLGELSTFSGMDKSFFLAINKCFSELCEGVTLVTTHNSLEPINRSGTSCHVNYINAAEKSYLELIERDAFLMHFLKPELYSEILKRHENNEITVVSNKLQTIDDQVTVVMSTIKEKSSGLFFIGLRAGKVSTTTEELLIDSLLEATMLFKAQFLPEFTVLEPGSRRQSLVDHLSASNEFKTRKAVEMIMSGGEGIHLMFQAPFDNFKVIERRNFVNRVVVRGKHASVLPLFFGKDWAQNKKLYEDKMMERKLAVSNWSVHPLL
ncbi:MAG: hypothetical protein ACJAS4_000862 [Bacteriovoracaceae bacterium]|jgi:hypothetical protein